MKRLAVTFTVLMAIIGLFSGCSGSTSDLCDSTVRDYLDAKKESDQADILSRNSGTRLTAQVLSFSWESDGSKRYKVYFADNKEYENADIYTAVLPSIVPDGIFIPGITYYWKVESEENGNVVHEDSFTTKAAPVRFITTAQVQNVRDLGGWETESGKTLKYGLLYRGGMTNPSGGNQFPEKDVALFRDKLGIRTEIDLRTPGQDDRDQTISILGEDAPYYKLPIHGYCYIIPGFRQMTPVYRAHNSDITDSIREIFHLLGDAANYPIYFHCNAGADRTGTIAYLICGVLGVSYEDLTRDFELTSFSQGGRRWRSEIIGGERFDPSGVMQDDKENYVAWGKMHQMMLEKYGAQSLEKTIEKYLTEACGVPQADIDNLRSIMLQ